MDRRSITNAESLQIVYNIMDQTRPQWREPTTSIATMALRTVYFCLTRVCPTLGETNLENQSYAGRAPLDIVPRCCSDCGRRLLDDSKPRFLDPDQNLYLAQTLVNGCGAEQCSSKESTAVAVDKTIVSRQYVGHTRFGRVARATWNDHLLLDEPNDQPSTMAIMCQTCTTECFDDKARWTIEDRPRYVTRKRKCDQCQVKKGCRYVPVDSKVPYIPADSLSKLWGKIKNDNLSPEGMKNQLENIKVVTG